MISPVRPDPQYSQLAPRSHLGLKQGAPKQTGGLETYWGLRLIGQPPQKYQGRGRALKILGAHRTLSPIRQYYLLAHGTPSWAPVYSNMPLVLSNALEAHRNPGGHLIRSKK